MPSEPNLTASLDVFEDIPGESRDERQDRTEERLFILRELAQLGMDLARVLVRESVGPGQTGETVGAPRKDPADAFARLSRAIRLTLSLEAKTDNELTALRAAAISPSGAAEPQPTSWSAPTPSLAPEPFSEPQANAAPDSPVPSAWKNPLSWPLLPLDYPTAFRNAVRDGVHDVMSHEITDPRVAYEALADLYENLWEGGDYDKHLQGSLKEAVAEICQSLGLQPDFSRWTADNRPPWIARGGSKWHERWIPRGILLPSLKVIRPTATTEPWWEFNPSPDLPQPDPEPKSEPKPELGPTGPP